MQIHGIGFTCLFELRIRDLDNGIAMDLFHRYNAAVVDADFLFHVTNILRDDLIVVADTIRDV